MAARKQDLDHLLDVARTLLPGSSESGMKGQLYDVFHEFFNDSNSWLEHISLAVIMGTTAYNLVPNQGQIIRLAGVMDVNSMPVPAFLPETELLVLTYPPGANATFVVTVVKNVTRPTDKTDIPDVPVWVLPRFGRTILEGLLGTMMGQPSKSYSNDTKSVYHLKRFRDGIAMARVAVLRANTMGAQSWSFPQQFRTRNQRSGISVGSNIGQGF